MHQTTANSDALVPADHYAAIPRERGGLPRTHDAATARGVLSFLTTSFRFGADAKTSTATNDDDQAPPLYPVAGGYTCSDDNCGGPDYCVHRWMRPIDEDAAWSLLACDASLSLVLDRDRDNVALARVTMLRLLNEHASPADLRRCGADWPRLMACGVTLDQLTLERGYRIEALIDGLALNWRALLSLGFTIFSLEHRDAYPLVILCEHPRIQLRGSLLLRTYPLRYVDFVQRIHLSQIELLALDMNAALLLAIGMRERDIVEACASPEIQRRDRGVAWYYRAFAWSMPLALKHQLSDYTKAAPRLRTAAREFARLYTDAITVVLGI